jgi:hypothetical protein
MTYATAIFAIFFVDLIVIALKIKYANIHNSQSDYSEIPGRIYFDMPRHVSDINFADGYPKMKVIKMVHHEQLHA